MIRHLGALATAMSTLAILTACGTSTSASSPPSAHGPTASSAQTAPAKAAATSPTTDERDETADDPSPSTTSDDVIGSVGDAVGGDTLTFNVLKVTQPADAARQMPSYLRGESDATGALADVKVCARKSVTSSVPFTGYGVFAAIDKSGGHYQQASSSWDAWPPLPQFPEDTKLRAGDCATGWVLLTTAATTKISGIVLTSDVTDQLVEWKVK